MPSTKLNAAVVQLCGCEDKDANLARAEQLIQQAAGQGANLVVLPEYFNCLTRMETVVENAEPLDGPTVKLLASLASTHGICLLGGICEAADEAGKAYNTLVLFDPVGNLIATYRKLHLFCVDLPGQIVFDEAQFILPGTSPCVVQAAGATMALATCYDLRFPELFRTFADCGVEAVLYPAAFTATTGRVHWEPLVRARAIENQCFVIAANQVGQHTKQLVSHGHSMIVDPWGEIVCGLTDEHNAISVGEIDLARVAEVRRQLPALEHRRRF